MVHHEYCTATNRTVRATERFKTAAQTQEEYMDSINQSAFVAIVGLLVPLIKEPLTTVLTGDAKGRAQQAVSNREEVEKALREFKDYSGVVDGLRAVEYFKQHDPFNYVIQNVNHFNSLSANDQALITKKLEYVRPWPVYYQHFVLNQCMISLGRSWRLPSRQKLKPSRESKMGRSWQTLQLLLVS
jgi:hypothetical protein